MSSERTCYMCGGQLINITDAARREFGVDSLGEDQLQCDDCGWIWVESDFDEDEQSVGGTAEPVAASATVRQGDEPPHLSWQQRAVDEALAEDQTNENA